MGKSRLILAAIPLVLFAGLAVVFAMQLTSGKDNAELPSALIDRQAPDFTLPALSGIDTPGLATTDLTTGKPTLVNIWASWCGPCRAEHPVLIALAKRDDLDVAGINYKDKPENAQGFLTSLGNPFDHVGVDEKGRAAIDWGFYGVPETFLVDGNGVIRHKIVGPITQAKYDELLQKLDALKAPAS